MNIENLYKGECYPVFLPDQLEPDENGPCLCLSGKLYGQCCKEKIRISRGKKSLGHNADGIDELFLTKRTKLPSVKMEKSVIRKKKLGYCLASDKLHDCSSTSAAGSPDIRFSHTMSRGYILKNLCNSSSEMVTAFDDHVMVGDTRIKLDERYVEVPIKEASITTSFCKKHDDYLFSDIEKEDKRVYDGSSLQSIEYALKAVTFEAFSCMTDVHYLASLLGQNPNVVYDNAKESRFLRDYRTKLMRAFVMKYFSDNMVLEIDECKKTGKESLLITDVIKLKNYSRVEYSLSEVFEDSCFVNVINAPDPYILVSYYPLPMPRNECFLNLVRKLKRNQNERTLREFTEYILCNAQNIYFNTNMINSLTDSDRKKLYAVHREGFKALDSGWRMLSTLMFCKLYTR